MRNFIFLILTAICLLFSLSLLAVGQSSVTQSGISGLYFGATEDSGSLGFFGGLGSNTTGFSFGFDISEEGIAKDYTGLENALNNTYDRRSATSLNILLGGYSSFDQKKPLGFVFSGANVMALVGAIDTIIRCPDGTEFSYSGRHCSDLAFRERVRKPNLGVLTTLQVKYLPLIFGIRYTKHSAAFVFGFGGLKAVN